MDNKKDILNNLPEKERANPFGVPKHYFEDFAARLQTRIETERKPEAHQPNIVIRFLRPALGLAASFVLIFLLVYWPIKKIIPTQHLVIQKDNYSNSEMEYLTMMEEIDEYSFFSLVVGLTNNSKLSDEDIAGYLQTNSSDYELYSETLN
ncbi:MAG: hypothetical protein CSA36_00345 [Draconibacterium sp.]|nr:MAG: hypothetical protein CSA36_00345 [Draconibacterium sp.]